MKVLLIEDEDSQAELINNEVAAYNLNIAVDEEPITIDRFKNDDKIYEAIFHNRYECIVLDINWGNGKELGGRELALKIVNKKRIPIIVWSGNLGQVDDIDERFGFKKFDRTSDPVLKVINQIDEYKKLRIFDLIGYEGVIDSKILDVFWKDMDTTSRFINSIASYENANALVRIIMTRIIESLNAEIQSGDEQKFFEFYIFPSLTNKPSNGDLFKIGEDYFLCVTPTCPLEQGKINNLTLLKINFSHEKLVRLKNVEPQKRPELLNSLIPGPSDFFHFIPPCGTAFDIGLVEFSSILTKTRDELMSERKIATINPSYMKDIQARFGQYFSKQGQPDIDKPHLIATLFPEGTSAMMTQCAKEVSAGITLAKDSIKKGKKAN